MPTKSKTKKAVSTAKSWKKATSTMELEVPSGEVCMVKRPGLPQLLASGALPDVLTPIAQSAVDAGQSGQSISEKELQEKMNALMQEEGGIESMLDSFSRIVSFCVVEPPVRFHKIEIDKGVWKEIPAEDRDPEFLYTDDIDLNDQVFIFQYVVGGSADLKQFRKQLGESVDSMANESGTKKDSI